MCYDRSDLISLSRTRGPVLTLKKETDLRMYLISYATSSETAEADHAN